MIYQKGMHLNHDFNVVVGKQCRIENDKDIVFRWLIIRTLRIDIIRHSLKQ